MTYWTGAVLAVGIVTSAAWAQAPGPNDPVLEADSAFMDEVRARPVPADMAGLLEVRAAFFFARDPKGREAVENLLAAMALAELDGRVLPVSGTVGQLVAAPPPAPAREEREKLLAAALKPLPAGPDDFDASLVDRSHEPLQLAPALWGTNDRNGSLQTLWVPLRVENTSGRRIEEYGAYLLIDLAKPPALRLACTRNVRKARMDAGQSSFALCSNQGRGAARMDELKEALARLPADPPHWRLELTHVRFADPQVSVHQHGGVFFMDKSAREKVAMDLRAADCRRRGSCLPEIERYVLDWHPEALLVPVGIVVALAIGLSIGRRSDHISRSVMKVFLVVFLLLMAAVAYAMVAGGEWSVVVAIFVAIAGAAAIGTFMIVVLLGVWIGRAFRPAGNRGLTP